MIEPRLLLEREIKTVLREFLVTLARCMRLDQWITLAMVQQHLSLALQGQVYLRSVVNVQLLRTNGANNTSQPSCSIQKERGKSHGATLRQAADKDFVMLPVQALDFLVDEGCDYAHRFSNVILVH